MYLYLSLLFPKRVWWWEELLARYCRLAIVRFTQLSPFPKRIAVFHYCRRCGHRFDSLLDPFSLRERIECGGCGAERVFSESTAGFSFLFFRECRRVRKKIMRGREERGLPRFFIDHLVCLHLVLTEASGYLPYERKGKTFDELERRARTAALTRVNARINFLRHTFYTTPLISTKRWCSRVWNSMKTAGKL